MKRLFTVAFLVLLVAGCGKKQGSDNPVNQGPGNNQNPTGPTYRLMAWGSMACEPCHKAYPEMVAELGDLLNQRVVVDMYVPEGKVSGGLAKPGDEEGLKNDLKLPFNYILDAKWTEYRKQIDKFQFKIPAAVLYDPQGVVVKKYPGGDFNGADIGKDIKKQLK